MTGLTNLEKLNLKDNQVTDLTPLVEISNNGGLGKGDEVRLKGNPLDLTPGSKACADIQALRDNGVKVHVEEGC